LILKVTKHMKKISIKDMQNLLQGRIPGQLVIQYADHCNATCPQCGMRVNNAFKRSRLKNDDVKQIIDHAAQNNFKAISFTGGEPLLFFDDIAELMHYAGMAGIDYIRTGTNGFIFMDSGHPKFEAKIHNFAEKLANTPIRNFWISIDSAIGEVHESMRGLPGVIAGIEKALPIFHSYGIYPSANLGINRNIGEKSSLSFPDQAETKDFYLNRFYIRFKKVTGKILRPDD
jgi:MoaA/NifB/PqqE/SkfB family radical SAM enzyme